MEISEKQNIDTLTYTSKSYVQDGLFHQWDGIDNAGFYRHDPTATVWKDLKGGDDFEFPTAMRFNDKSLKSDTAGYGTAIKTLANPADDGWTVELVFSSYGKELNQIQDVFFNVTGQFALYLKYNEYSPALRLQNNTSSAFMNILNGNLDGWQHVVFTGFRKPADFPGGTERYVISYDRNGDEVYRQSAGNSGLPIFEEVWKSYYALSRIQLGNLAGRFFTVRYYDRVLSDEEIRKNDEIDRERFL